ncbi:hypothetical protein VTN77DRAFT_95 [Rasamsonia byssochlamydoides]|uniref:uncharacterized protein n=1 Tax=Rasamsonia byssochlamydoides TaxID=89139 RepID=UPI003742539E
MSAESNEERLSRLARVRENQRKSRARRQQYIQELEQKVAACRAQVQQKDIEQRLSLQKLQRENVKLRNLLISLGVDGAYIDEYLRGDDDQATSQKIAIPALRRRLEPSTQPASEPGRSSGNSCSKDAGHASDLNLPDRAADKQPGPSSDSTAETSRTSDQQHETAAALKTVSGATAICDCSDNSWPANESALNTTLCAIAEELIHQYNTRGVDMSVIKEKLWAGFRKGMSAGEGCRVQNHILFEVLDEISGNLS